MTRTDEVLTTAAQNIALELQDQANHLKSELEDIEVEKRQVEMKLDATRSAIKRAVKFQVRIGNLVQCPNCWVRKNQQVALTQIPGTRHVDLHRCDVCGWDIAIPFGI